MPDITAIDYGRLLSEFAASKIGGIQARNQTTPRGAHLRTRLPFGDL